MTIVVLTKIIKLSYNYSSIVLPFLIIINLFPYISSYPIVDNHQISSFSCDSFNISSYNSSEICNSIHLSGKDKNQTNLPLNCRILNGSLTLRDLDIGHLDAFIDLEVIVDFVVLKNVYSTTNRTLKDILPNLRSIYGRYQVLYYTIFVHHYGIGDDLQIPTLKNVCGNIKLERTSGSCFPHSNTYWNILTSQKITHPEKNIPTIDDQRIYRRINETHFFGMIRLPIFDDSGANSVRQNRFEKLRLVSYEIDSTMFEFYKNFPTNNDKKTKYIEKYVKNSRCYRIGWNRVFGIGNLWNYENVKFIQDYHQINFVLDSKAFPTYPNRLMEAKQEYSDGNDFEYLNNYFDILRINATNIAFDGFRYYEFNDSFRYGSYYVLKVMLCTGSLITNCSIDRIFLYRHVLQTISKQIIGWNFVIAFISFGVLFMLFLWLRIYLSKKKFQKNIISFNPEYMPLSSFQTHSDMISRKCSEIDENRLLLNADNLLGKGQFGYVYEGYLNDYTLGSHCIIPGNEEHCDHEFQNVDSNNFEKNSLRVAIKQLKSNVNDAEKERFLLEANIMRNFDSSFLVKLIGVCSIKEPVMVVMEFMESGDLKRYLVRCQHLYKKTKCSKNIPSREQMLLWAIQIADGMFYLHSKQIIHRDLASRNCMLTKDLSIKIGDFGLTRHVIGGDYYRLSCQVSMPLRWMAPESLQRMIFTPKTDVWSYGVVLWEIMSLGKQPYKGISDDLVKGLIISHTRLPNPGSDCSFLWDLTKFCWTKSPCHRPSFETVLRILLPRLSHESRVRFSTLSFFTKVFSFDLNLQEPIDNSSQGFLSRAWNIFYQKFLTNQNQNSSNNQLTIKQSPNNDSMSFYSRYRRFRKTKHYPDLFIRSNSNSSGSSASSGCSDMIGNSPIGPETGRKISYDSVYSSATQDYSSDSK